MTAVAGSARVIFLEVESNQILMGRVTSRIEPAVGRIELIHLTAEALYMYLPRIHKKREYKRLTWENQSNCGLDYSCAVVNIVCVNCCVFGVSFDCFFTCCLAALLAILRGW